MEALLNSGGLAIILLVVGVIVACSPVMPYNRPSKDE